MSANYRDFIPVDEYPPERRDEAWEGNGDGKPRVIVPGQEKPEPAPLPIMTAGALMNTYPDRRPAVIDGLLRVGETMNVIAAPKIGKSWLTLSLAFAIATGRPWLSTFQTRQGRVLIIDNELHAETIAHRLRTLAVALNWPADDIAGTIDVVALRGRLENLYGLGAGLEKIEHGRYALILIDAWYRTLPQGADENDNATMAALYNRLDCIADAIGASFGNVHHSSKGDQSGKAITDVGAGAGAQSRATDTHLILRPHEEDNVVVLDGAVRSWAPVTPLCLRWDFPRWIPAPDLDPADLRLPKPRRRKPESQEPAKPPEPPWTAKRFAETFGTPEPQSTAVILDKARAAALPGLSERMAEKLLKAAIDGGQFVPWPSDDRRKTIVATVPPPAKKPRARVRATKKGVSPQKNRDQT